MLLRLELLKLFLVIGCLGRLAGKLIPLTEACILPHVVSQKRCCLYQRAADGAKPKLSLPAATAPLPSPTLPPGRYTISLESGRQFCGNSRGV